MALYLKITSPKEWVAGDYTDNATHDFNCTIYSDPQMQNTVDLTSFTTTTLKLFDPNFNESEVYSTTIGITTTNAGVLTWRPTISSAPGVHGGLKVRVVLQDSTQKLTAIGVVGSDELFIKRQ